VDPMLSNKGALDPVQNAANTNRIPLVDLPFDASELQKLLQQADAILVTHTHRDHWDIAAQQLIDKDKLIICQPEDEATVKSQGFNNVHPIESSWEWNAIHITRTSGQHGAGEIGKKMGTVSGYILEYNKERLYIAGDTIWCNDVETAITTHHPTHIVINGGGAQFLQGDPITMTTADMVKLAQFINVPVSVVHLESVNHCYQRRADFREAISNNNLTHRINIPNDGEWITI
jgi:L-ascorbate metabolism protein UlaG (beta-lactamase superfamily)